MPSPNQPPSTPSVPSAQSTKDKQQSQSTYNPPHPSSHAVEPSGPKGDNPATAGPGPYKVQSATPENRLGRINPSAPEDSNTTPGTNLEK